MGKTKGKVESSGPKSIHNRKARFEYEIFEEFEAGIVLVGSEVKSLFNQAKIDACNKEVADFMATANFAVGADLGAIRKSRFDACMTRTA